MADLTFNLKWCRYYLKNEAEDSIRYINGTRLDDRIVRTDWDAGFIEGRQYGRGKTGGQVNFTPKLELTVTMPNPCDVNR